MGYSPAKIEVASRTEEARENGVLKPIKQETIYKHLNVCVVKALTGREAKDISRDTASELVLAQSRLQIGQADPDDLAVMIRKAAAEKLRAGELRITAQHGLAAQAMLDRRTESEAKNRLALTIARALTASQPTVLEGIFEELE